MNQTISSTGQIKINDNLGLPRLEFMGKYYLDSYSIRKIIGEDKIAKTTLFYLLDALPFKEQFMIKHRNKHFYCQTYIEIHLRDLICSNR